MKNKKVIFILIAVLFVVGLVFINRNSTQKQIDMANSMQLLIEINSKEEVYHYSEDHQAYTTFDTQMKRKNGDIFDKNYSGISLANILKDMDVLTSEDTTITVMCADQYEITLTGGEILADDNVYLITHENGEKLDEECGNFMLVINQDEFSTRWAKNVVKVKVQ